MDLTKWTTMPEERQHELIIQCFKGDHWSEYEELALEAAGALKNELAPILEITNVVIGGGQVILDESPMIIVRELMLNVCTLLPEASCLRQIPPRFAGFRVQQLNFGDKRESFLRTWKRLFKEIKGWDERTTLVWAKQWEDDLSGRPSTVIYHYGPVKTALPSLVDERIKQAAGKRLRVLYGEILNVCERTENTESLRVVHPDTVENYDWEYVRSRIAALIEEYRAT